MQISIGGDHAGYDLKKHLKSMLEQSGYEIEDFGTHSEESVDYPDYVHPVAESIKNAENKLGILICGSANGVCMTANKHQHIRAALCWTEEIAKLAREHNNANVLCIPARFVTTEEAEKITNTFLNTAFEGGRHQRRVDKISCS